MRKSSANINSHIIHSLETTEAGGDVPKPFKSRTEPSVRWILVFHTFKPFLLSATLGLAFICSVTCVMFSGAGSQLKGSRRFHASADALQQGEKGVPIICAVDVGCIGLQQLMKTISHLSADPGQHMRFHHEKEAQREENLDARCTRHTRSETKKHIRPQGGRIHLTDTVKNMSGLLVGRVNKWNMLSLKTCLSFSHIHE